MARLAVRQRPVLDPFAGSGTTLLACKSAGLPCVGIEINPEHAATVAARCSQTETAL
jgi:DNA modification methylase